MNGQKNGPAGKRSRKKTERMLFSSGSVKRDQLGRDHDVGARELVERMDDLNADIILSNYSNCYDNGKVEVIDDFPRLIKGKTYTFDELQPLVEWMRNCTVIYRTELLQAHDIQLDEKCFYVDAEYALYPIPYVNTIFYAKEFLYCYRLGRTEQSVSRENRQRLIADGKRVSESLIKYYASVKNQLTECKKLYFLY